MNRYPKDWKAFTFDYNEIESFSDDDCTICITKREVAIIQGLLSPAYWRTRWVNLPPEIDLHVYIGELENKIMACLNCGNDCGCGGSTIETNNFITNVTTETNTTVTTYITNPAGFLPDIQSPPDAIAQELLDAALCTALQMLVAAAIKVIQEGLNHTADNECGLVDDVFDVGQAVLNEINQQATMAGWITAGASVFNPSFAVVSAAAAFTAGAADLTSNFLNFVRPSCDQPDSFPPVPDGQIEAMACCLWQNLKGGGFTYDAWVTSMANLTIPCTKIDTDEWPGGLESGATTYNLFANALRAGWSNLETYVNVANMANSVVNSVGGIAPAPCPCAPECVDSAPATDVLLFDGVNGPQPGVVMSPPPPPYASGYLWTQSEVEAGIVVTVPFRRCISAIRCTIGRSAGSNVPAHFEAFILGQYEVGTVGGTGPEPLEILVSPPVRSTTFILRFQNGFPKADVLIGQDFRISIKDE